MSLCEKNLPEQGDGNKETWQSTEGNKHTPWIILREGTCWEKGTPKKERKKDAQEVHGPENELDRSNQYREEWRPRQGRQQQYFRPGNHTG